MTFVTRRLLAAAYVWFVLGMIGSPPIYTDPSYPFYIVGGAAGSLLFVAAIKALWLGGRRAKNKAMAQL